MLEHVTGIAIEHKLDLPAPLNGGWAFLALDDSDLDKLFSPPQDFLGGDFIYLSQQLIQFLIENSSASPLAYIETDYFGGVGTQGALACHKAAQIGEPLTGRDAINAALASIGANASGGGDLFNRIGLSSLRNNEDAKEANQQNSGTYVDRPRRSS